MRKKALSWILSLAMVCSLFTAVPITAHASDYECQIVQTSTYYDTLDQALIYVADGQTIKLLKDVTYGSTILAYVGSLTLDVNGWSLSVGTTNQTCLYAGNGYDLTITDSAGGGSVALSASGGSGLAGLYANGYGSEINIDVPTSVNVVGDSSYGVYAITGGVVSVTGDITVSGTASYGAYADSGVYGSLVTIDGEIYSTNYVYVNGNSFYGPDECITPTTKEGYYTFRDTGDSANPQSTVWVKEITYVCEVDGVQYETLDEGLAAAAVDEDTIKLLTDIDYTGQLSPTADTWFNLNGYSLNVTNTAGAALWVHNGIDVYIDGEGEFNLTGSWGVTIGENASAEVTNVTATVANGLGVDIGYSDSNIHVYGNVTANGDGGAFGVSGRGFAVIEGNVYAQGTNGTGVVALGSADITVRGYIEASNYLSLDGVVRAEENYDSVLNNYYAYTNDTATVQVRQEVCQLIGTPYLFLEDALADAEDGDTITLLADIRYENEIELIEKDLTLDLDSYTLNLGRTGSNPALLVDGCVLTIDDTDEGELNIVAGINAVKVQNGGAATVTSIFPISEGSITGTGITGESGGSATVKGDISYVKGHALSLLGGASAHVMGNIDHSLYGIVVQQSGSEAVVEGNITADNGYCAYVTNGGSIIVYGDVHGNSRTVQGGSDGGSIHIMGDVVADRWEGVQAWSGADIVIDGSVTSPYGLYAWGEGTTVLVKGNTVTTDSEYEYSSETDYYPTYGAYAFDGAEITVGGTITPADPTNYVKVGDTVMTEAEGVLQGHYTVFSDGESAVRTKGYEFFFDDCEGALSDNWTQSEYGWSAASTLTSPTATAHSGSTVYKFNSFSLTNGFTSRLYLNDGLDLTFGTNYKLEFWMYHDSGWSAFHDSIIVQVSTDGGENWTDLDTVERVDGSEGWKKESIDLYDYDGYPEVMIGFLGVSAIGNNMFIDDISVSHECIINGCEVTEAYGGFITAQEIEGETYYEVTSAAQLAHINDHMDLNFIQTEDIDLAGYNGGYWTPIGGFTYPQYFTGKYLGNGHTIQNLRCFLDSGEVNDSYFGLFAYINGSDTLVSDLTVTVAGVNITNYSTCFGAIAGSIDGSTIQNCSVTILDDIITQTVYGEVGGIVGRAYSNYDSELEAYVGGIENCTVTLESGSIRNESPLGHAGGIVGYDYASLQNCDVVVGAGEYIRASRVGGIAASTYKVYNAFTDCTVTGEGSLQICPNNEYDTYIGGIVGYASEVTIENCRNSVLVDATGISKIAQGEQVWVGGIVGRIESNSTIYGCVNTGNVELEIADNVVNQSGEQVEPEGIEYAFAGGIAGYVYGYYYPVTIENCENNANVSAVNLIPTMRAYAGGLVGHIDSYDGGYDGVTVLNCANLGHGMEVTAIASTTMAGGLAGSTTYADFDTPSILIQNCYNEAGVYTESNGLPDPDSFCVGVTAGGLIGAAGEAIVNYCYSTASNISAVNEYGDVYAGGLFGLLYNTAASQNYCETNENVTRAAGAVVDGMTIVGEDDLSGSYECATATQLKTKSFYGNGWSWYTSGGIAPDYYSTSAPWRMPAANTYPVLKGEAYTEPTAPPAGGSGTTITYYSITASAGSGGSIDPSGSVSVQKNLSKTFSITPESGYVITDVLVDGVSVGAVTEYTFSGITEDHTITASFEHPSRQFIDVDGSLWYRGGIDFVLIAGLFNGTSNTTFEPNTDMSRAMLVTVLWRLDNEPDTTLSDLFADIAAGTWYTDAVAWASEAGIVEGYDADTFGPDDSITREQMAAILYRYASYKGYDVTAMDDLSEFDDADDTSAWALTAMQWAVAEGLIQGVGGNQLDPAGHATRAQVATILMRFVQNIVE